MPTHKKDGPGGPKNGEAPDSKKVIDFPLPGDQKVKGGVTPSAQEITERLLSNQEERSGARSRKSQSTQEEKKEDFSIINSIYKFVKKHWVKFAGAVAIATILPAAFAGINVPSAIYSFATTAVNMLAETSVGKALAIIPWQGSVIVGAGYLALRCALHSTFNGIKSITPEYINNRLAGTGLIGGLFYGLTVAPLAVGTLAFWTGIGLVGGFVTSAIVGGLGIEYSTRKGTKENTEIINMNSRIREALASALDKPKQLNAQITHSLTQKKRTEAQIAEKNTELGKLNEVAGQEKDEEGIAVLKERIEVLNDELGAIVDCVRENKQSLFEAYYYFFNGELYSTIINGPSDFENLNNIRTAIKDFIEQCDDYPGKIRYTLELAFLLLKMDRTQETSNVLQNVKNLLNDYKIDLATKRRTALRNENTDKVQEIDETLAVGDYKELEVMIQIADYKLELATTGKIKSNKEIDEATGGETKSNKRIDEAIVWRIQSIILLHNSNAVQNAIRKMSEGEDQKSAEDQDEQEEVQIPSQTQLPDQAIATTVPQLGFQAVNKELAEKYLTRFELGVKYPVAYDADYNSPRKATIVYPVEDLNSYVAMLSTKRDIMCRILLQHSGVLTYKIGWGKIKKSTISDSVEIPTSMLSEEGTYRLVFQVDRGILRRKYVDVAEYTFEVKDPKKEYTTVDETLRTEHLRNLGIYFFTDPTRNLVEDRPEIHLDEGKPAIQVRATTNSPVDISLELQNTSGGNPWKWEPISYEGEYSHKFTLDNRMAPGHYTATVLAGGKPAITFEFDAVNYTYIQPEPPAG